MNENLERLKALVAETNEVVSNLQKETDNIKADNQAVRVEKFRKIRDYLMECHEIAKSCGDVITIKLDINHKYLGYDTVNYMRISCNTCEKKPITFGYDFCRRDGWDRYNWSSSYGIAPDSEWDPGKTKQYMFNSSWDASDEQDFVDNWDQADFDKKFAAEVERIITEKANKANEKYQKAVTSSETLSTFERR